MQVLKLSRDDVRAAQSTSKEESELMLIELAPLLATWKELKGFYMATMAT